MDRVRLNQQRRSRLSAASLDLDDISRHPLATTMQERGVVRIVATCPAARAGGVLPGQPLADARALLPTLLAQNDDPIGDATALQQLARWCVRYTPWTTPEDNHGVFSSGAGIWLDVSGCAHLMGGEVKLLGDLLLRLSSAGYNARAAIADTPGAAWALSRHANDRTSIVTHDLKACMPLPATGLRLPAVVLNDLHRLGLRTIGSLFDVARASLTIRFGTTITRRLDQLSGQLAEPLSPLIPTPVRRARLTFAEPIGTRDDMGTALRHLLDDLCLSMEKAHEGARRLSLMICRMDGTTTETTVGTSRPVRDTDHLARLFRGKLDAIDPGFGIEVMILNALETAPLTVRQTATIVPVKSEHDNMAPLVDRLANRLGSNNVATLRTRASHIPEYASREYPVMMKTTDALCQSAAIMGKYSPRAERPIHLLPQPDPIDVMASLPDHPPALFRWRQNHYRITRADGPERLGPEWWPEIMRNDPRTRETRDYYAVEDENGGRYWVYREGPYRPDHTPRWYLHGLFA